MPHLGHLIRCSSFNFFFSSALSFLCFSSSIFFLFSNSILTKCSSSLSLGFIDSASFICFLKLVFSLFQHPPRPERYLFYKLFKYTLQNHNNILPKGINVKI